MVFAQAAGEISSVIKQPSETNCCPMCGYDLRGIPEQACPECGFGYQHAALEKLALANAVSAESRFESLWGWLTLASLLVAGAALPTKAGQASSGIAGLAAIPAIVLFFHVRARQSGWTFSRWWGLPLGIAGCAVMWKVSELGWFNPRIAACAVLAVCGWKLIAPVDPYKYDELALSETIQRGLRRGRWVAWIWFGANVAILTATWGL